MTRSGETGKSPRKSSFNSLLQKIKREEFQEFIQQYAAKHQDFKTEFEIYFSDKDARIDVAEKYTKLIRKLIHHHSDRGFVDYRSAFSLAKEADQLTQGGYDLMRKQNYRDAFLMARSMLREMMEVITACDDSSGSIGGSIHEIIQLLGAVAQSEEAAPVLKAEVFEFLQNELTNKLYFEYGDFGYSLLNIYQNLAVALGRHANFIGFIDRQVSQLRGPYEGYRRDYYLKLKINFLQSLGRSEEVAELTAKHLDIVDVRQGEIDRAIANQEYSWAKELIAGGVKIAEGKQHPGTVAQWEKQRLRVAELEDDLKTVRYYTRHFAFDRGFDKTYYRQWKKTFSAKEWEEEIESFIKSRKKEVLRQHEAHKKSFWAPAQPPLLFALAPIYIEERYWDRLLALVQQENSLSNVLQYHSYLAKHYPAELLEMYLPAFEQEGERVNSRKEYADLARKMKKVMKDIPEGKEKIQAIAQQLKEKYPRRPAMQEELNKVVNQ